MLKRDIDQQLDKGESMGCEYGTYSNGEDRVFYPGKKEKPKWRNENSRHGGI